VRRWATWRTYAARSTTITTSISTFTLEGDRWGHCRNRACRGGAVRVAKSRAQQRAVPSLCVPHSMNEHPRVDGHRNPRRSDHRAGGAGRSGEELALADGGA